MCEWHTLSPVWLSVTPWTIACRLLCLRDFPGKNTSELPFYSCLLKPAAAAAKSLQSCPTLCNPIDGSPPGSPVPGMLFKHIYWVVHTVTFLYIYSWTKISSEVQYIDSNTCHFSLLPEISVKGLICEQVMLGRNINNLRYADDTTLMEEIPWIFMSKFNILTFYFHSIK